MAIALTAVQECIWSDGNKKVVKYLCTLTGTYPSGGYTVNNAVYPSAAQVFKRVDGVWFQSQFDLTTGDVYHVEESDINNTSTSNPSFKVRVMQMATGGVDFSEVATGTAIASTFYIYVLGIKKYGVVCDPS